MYVVKKKMACKGGGSNNHKDMPGFGRHMSNEIVSMLTYRLPGLEVVPRWPKQ